MDRNALVFIGGGGHAKSVLDAVNRAGSFGQIYVTDEKLPAGTRLSEQAVVAGTDDLLDELYEQGCRNAFITVGYLSQATLRIRRKLGKKVEEIGYCFPNIADPSAVIANPQIVLSASEWKGIFLGKLAVVNADVSIGSHVIINTGAVIEHDCRIGSFTHVAVGAILCGNVSVGENVFIGAGTVVIQGIQIGSDAVIGAGSVVLRDVKEGEKVMGIVK